MPKDLKDRKAVAAISTAAVALRIVKEIKNTILKKLQRSGITGPSQIKKDLQKNKDGKYTPKNSYPVHLEKKIAKKEVVRAQVTELLKDIKDPESAEGLLEVTRRINDLIDTPTGISDFFGIWNPYTQAVVTFFQGEAPDPEQRGIRDFFDSKDGKIGARPQEGLPPPASQPSTRQQTLDELKGEGKEREEKVPQTPAQVASLLASRPGHKQTASERREEKTALRRYNAEVRRLNSIQIAFQNSPAGILWEDNATPEERKFNDFQFEPRPTFEFKRTLTPYELSFLNDKDFSDEKTRANEWFKTPKGRARAIELNGRKVDYTPYNPPITPPGFKARAPLIGPARPRSSVRLVQPPPDIKDLMSPTERRRLIGALSGETKLTGIPINLGGFRTTVPFHLMSNAGLFTLVTANSRLFNNPIVQRVIRGMPQLLDANLALNQEILKERRELVKKALVSTLSDNKQSGSSPSMSGILSRQETKDYQSGTPIASKKLDRMIKEAENDPVVYQKLIDGLLNDPSASETFRKIDKKDYPDVKALASVENRMGNIIASGIAGGVGALAGGASALGGIAGAGLGAIGGAVLDRTGLSDGTRGTPRIVPPLVGAALGVATQSSIAGSTKEVAEQAVDDGLKATGQAPLVQKTPVVLPTQANVQQENNNKKQFRPKFIAPSSEILEPTRAQMLIDNHEFTAFDFVKSGDWGNGAGDKNVLMKAQEVSNELLHLGWRQAILREELKYLNTKAPSLRQMKPAPYDSFNPSQFEEMEFIPSQPLGFESPYRFGTDVDGTNMEIKTSVLYGLVP